MEQDFNTKNWTNPCPKYDCRKDKCVCGLEMVRIPAPLGDDSEDSKVAPHNGAYCNSLVIYEANDHIYIYTKEGIPTLIDVDASDISTLEQEVVKAQKDIAEFREDIDRFAYFFDTVADMKASDQLHAGDYAKTLGYYSRNDGGGAYYKITNVQPSGYYEMLSGMLYAELIMNPAMNVKQFGVTTANTTNGKFQTALTECEGRKLIIPEGTYRVDSSMTLPDNIEIECHGKITYSGDIVYLFQHPDDTSTGNITFDGIEIEKLDNSFNNLNRFIMVRGGNLRVVNSTFTNYATAIHALFTNSLYCDNNKFYNAHGTEPQYGYGIDTSSMVDTITNNYFVNTNNTQGRHAVYLNGETKTYSFIDNLYVEHWQHNPINIAITNANPSKIVITNFTCKDGLITSPGSSTTGRIGVIHLSDDSTNVELIIDSLNIEGTLRDAVVAISATSRAKITNVNCKFGTGGVSTNWNGMYLRYNNYYLSDIHFEIPDPETTALNHAVILNGCTAYINNITSNATYGVNKNLVNAVNSTAILGLYANGTISGSGTYTITPMTIYSE